MAGQHGRPARWLGDMRHKAAITRTQATTRIKRRRVSRRRSDGGTIAYRRPYDECLDHVCFSSWQCRTSAVESYRSLNVAAEVVRSCHAGVVDRHMHIANIDAVTGCGARTLQAYDVVGF